MTAHRSCLVVAFVLGLLLTPLWAAAAITLSVTDKGVKVDEGPSGAFVIEYPMLGNDAHAEVHKLIEKNTDGGKAVLKYEGGGQITVEINGGNIKYTFASMPADVTSFTTNSLVSFDYSTGGTWAVDGGAETAFPKDKPDKPHLFQGTTAKATLKDPQGTKVTFGFPSYTYFELQDNREWNWKIFAWKAHTPFDANNPVYQYTVAQGDAAAAPGAKAPAAAAESYKLSVADDGVVIDAATMGKFTLPYPELGNKDQAPVHKLIEKQIAGGKATIKYEGGGQLVVDVTTAGEINYKFSSMPDDVGVFVETMIIEYGVANDGTWKFDAASPQPFPKEKPAKPHLFQDHATTFTFHTAAGKVLSIQSPAYTFQEITDNREWGWKVFALKLHTPYITGQDAYTIKVLAGDAPAPGAEAAPAAAADRVILVDEFGQSPKADFPDKVKSVDELKADVASEKAYYDSLQPPPRDTFGGLPGSGDKLGLKKTGFFHVEAKGEKWFLVDPDGNAFYLLGVCATTPGDDYTLVQGRESIYQWLPPKTGDLVSAWKSDSPGVMSFHLANQIRKYGKAYTPEDYTARMLTRMRKWGFNCTGPFSGVNKANHDANFPYLSSLPLWQWQKHPILAIPGIASTWDPFDEKNVAAVEAEFAELLPTNVNDPLLVGYFLANEPLFEDVPRVVPHLSGKYACKRQLVKGLTEKYQDIDAFNTAWNMHAKSFEELNDSGLPVTTPSAAADVQAFTDLFFETYYKLVADTFHKYDTNHMLVGNRFQSGTINNDHLLATCGKYMDIVSFNYYTYGIDKDFLKRIYKWCGKPMLLTEYFFDSSNDSGLPGGGKDVATQEQRGLAYRNYVEQSASVDFVLGDEWFTLVDQSLTGRWFQQYNGENANSGIIAVTDRPWKAMLAHMMESNYDIYAVAMGQRKPFAWDDPRFVMSMAAHKSLSIPRAAGEVKMDGTAAGFPGTPAEQIPASRLVMGTDAGGVEASFKVCWDDANLYLLADVTDPTPMKNTNVPNMLWSGDGVEVFLGVSKPAEDGAVHFDDHQILLGAGKTDGRDQTYVTQCQTQPNIRLVVVPNVNGKGYTLEAAIPFVGLGFTPAKGQTVRFDIGVDDSADGTRRLRQLMWNGTERNSGDRTGWGRAVFLGQ